MAAWRVPPLVARSSIPVGCLPIETPPPHQASNPEKDRPYLDGVEYSIIRDRPVPRLKDVRSQKPDAICELTPEGSINRHLLVNGDVPPFNNPDLLGRWRSRSIKAFIDIFSEGQGDIGGILQPPPERLWGMPPDLLKELPGYDPDVYKSRAEACHIMEKLGYGPDDRFKIRVSTRDLAIYRDPAVILIDQLKEVYFDGELEIIDTSRYFPKLMRKEFTVGLSLQTSGPDPDPILDVLYGCGANLNWDGYCNPEVDKLIERAGGDWIRTFSSARR
jgi:peptide/nickel transport system substrate-binding protein